MNRRSAKFSNQSAELAHFSQTIISLIRKENFVFRTENEIESLPSLSPQTYFPSKNLTFEDYIIYIVVYI